MVREKDFGGDDTSVHEPKHWSSVSSTALHDVHLVSKSPDCLFLVCHLMLESQNQTLLKQKYPAFPVPLSTLEFQQNPESQHSLIGHSNGALNPKLLGTYADEIDC